MVYPKKFLLQFLKALEKTKENPANGGICNNINNYFFSKQYQMKKIKLRHTLFRLWPKFSGNPSFPVPHESDIPADAFFSCARYRNGWDRSTQYGRDRWELLEFMIEEVKHMIEYIDEQEEDEDDL